MVFALCDYYLQGKSKLILPVSRFGNNNRSEKKQTIIGKLKAFFEEYFGIGTAKFMDMVEDEVN